MGYNLYNILSDNEPDKVQLEWKNIKSNEAASFWFAPGAQSHLQVPRVTGGGEVCLKLILRVTPLNVGEIKVLEGTHGSDPMGLRREQVGL